MLLLYISKACYKELNDLKKESKHIYAIGNKISTNQYLIYDLINKEKAIEKKKKKKIWIK